MDKNEQKAILLEKEKEGLPVVRPNVTGQFAGVGACAGAEEDRSGGQQMDPAAA